MEVGVGDGAVCGLGHGSVASGRALSAMVAFCAPTPEIPALLRGRAHLCGRGHQEPAGLNVTEHLLFQTLPRLSPAPQPGERRRKSSAWPPPQQ